MIMEGGILSQIKIIGVWNVIRKEKLTRVKGFFSFDSFRGFLWVNDSLVEIQVPTITEYIVIMLYRPA